MATKDLRFCPSCSNMLYLREKEAVGTIMMVEFCRRCGYETEPEPAENSTNVVVYEKVYTGDYVKPRIDEIAFGDPAVPTTREIRCPNNECPSNRDTAGAPEPSAKFIVMDYASYSILYQCQHCSRVWKNQN